MNAPRSNPLRAAEWREAFDRSFAEPALRSDLQRQDFLGLSLGGQAYALPLAEVAGLHKWREPTPYPGGPATLLGLIAERGTTLPLYDLRALLGHGAAPRPAWLLIARAAPLALAFEDFDGHWRVAPEEALQPPERGGDPLLGRVLRCDGRLRPLIKLAAVADLLQDGAGR